MIKNAQVAELVDAHVSGACSERSAGSSPVPGTKKTSSVFFLFPLLFYVRKKYENIPNFLPLIPVF